MAVKRSNNLVQLKKYLADNTYGVQRYEALYILINTQVLSQWLIGHVRTIENVGIQLAEIIEEPFFFLDTFSI